MAYTEKMVGTRASTLAHEYFGGLTHAHTVLSNHPSHHESNLTVDRIVETLHESGLAGTHDAPLKYIMLNEHPSDPAKPHLLGRMSIRGRKLLKQRRRPIVGRIPILYGLEVSLLPSGKTDLTPRLADHCPLVIASRHGLPVQLQRDDAATTELFMNACDNPAIDVIGHPPRYIEDLEEVDWMQIFAKAAQTGTAIEINFNTFPDHNAHPIQSAFWKKWLTDLSKSKAQIIIGTDIHNQLQLDSFISQWQQIDENKGQRENHLTTFVKALHDAHIKPRRVVTSEYNLFLNWLNLTKTERSELQ